MNGNRLPLPCVRFRNAADLGTGDDLHRHLDACPACRTAFDRGANLAIHTRKEAKVPLPPPWEAVLKRIEMPEPLIPDVPGEVTSGWRGVSQLAVSCALFLLLAVGAREARLPDCDAGRGERKLLAFAGRAFEHYRIAVVGESRLDAGNDKGGKEP
ncbi:MAG TPA: hypothetical protein VIV61_05965 [Candidatus Ozemobacteraceae bacterium]